MSHGDTIFALSTGRPPAAIAIIRVSGPQAHEAGLRIAGSLPEPRTAAVRAFQHPVTGDLIDEGLLLRFNKPASATGENVVEFHVHGSRAVADAMSDALTSLDGLRRAEPGEFTRRAFEYGRIDLTEAEGLADLLEAETETQRRAALAMAEGGLRRQVAAWQERLLSLSARAETAIDYVGEVGEEQDEQLSRDCGALAKELGEWLERPRVEPLKDGLRIVVAGPPNAGKSSLVNAIAGTDRAIVTAVPGTTRDYIEVPLALGGIPILLTDTAGLRQSCDSVEEIGVQRARDLASGADILLWLGEPGDAPPHPRSIRVHARCDLPDRRSQPEGSIAVSSVSGEGLRALLDAIGQLARSFIPADDALALNRRQGEQLAQAQAALAAAAHGADLVFIAEDLRVARAAFDRLTGRAAIEDVLDALFGRFCLGK